MAHQYMTPDAMLSVGIESLIRRIPKTWQKYNPDELSDIERQSLTLLTHSGLVDRRERRRIRFINHPVSVEGTITFKGISGEDDALSKMLDEIRHEWNESYKSWRKEIKSSGRNPDKETPLKTDEIGPFEWCLTAEGEGARDYLDFPIDSEERCHVFSFVLKTGLNMFCDYAKGIGSLIDCHRVSSSEKDVTTSPYVSDAKGKPMVQHHGSGDINVVIGNKSVAGVGRKNTAASASEKGKSLATKRTMKKVPSKKKRGSGG